MNITRVWHGIIRREDAEAYKKYVEETGIKNYLNTEGNVSAKILLKYENKICHIITVSEWESLEDIKKFAGEDYKKARYFEEDKRFLLEFEEFVEHYETYNYDRN